MLLYFYLFIFFKLTRTKIGLANLEDCFILDEDATDDLIKNQQGCPGNRIKLL